MDNSGWKAARKAAQEDQLYDHPQRQANGHFIGVEHVGPMNEAYEVEFRPRGVPHPWDSQGGTSVQDPSGSSIKSTSDVKLSTESTSSTALERSQNQQHQAPPRMNPHLQLMCGPLLRYDTVDLRGNYRGALLIVTADAGSVYDPHPNVILEWDPGLSASSRDYLNHLREGSIGPKGLESVIGSPPALAEAPPAAAPIGDGSRAQKEVLPGHEIWVYQEGEATYTFWRFIFEIPLSENEMRVRYRVNQGPTHGFFVPGRDQNMRWAAYSCNGFSAGVNAEEFRGPGFSSGFDPVWTDLLSKHEETPFHVLVGGGDQLYCDAVTREPELQAWVKTKDLPLKMTLPLTDEIKEAVDRFYFNHYCNVFRTGAFAQANSAIPMLNMLDDHDLIDGFGSYPDDLQSSPIFSWIGSRGYFYFLLFQCFIVPAVDGINPTPYSHTFRSTVIGGIGPWIPYPSHSALSYMGPNVWILLLDCRAERKKGQVCSDAQYKRVMKVLYQLPRGVEHLVVLVGIPIAYPRMNFLESALESKFNPLVAIGRNSSLGLSSVVNKFNSEAELLDDLNDHWTAKGHKKERNWLVERMQDFAKSKHVRVSFLSGDVHCAAVGVFKTLHKGKGAPAMPQDDHRYMINVVSSAIVNTPPPPGVLQFVALLADKRHKSMHYAATDETMIPIFVKDTNGTAQKSKYIMGRRNWCDVRWDRSTGELVFDIRVEREKGIGKTVGYAVRAPPPAWP